MEEGGKGMGGLMRGLKDGMRGLFSGASDSEAGVMQAGHRSESGPNLYDVKLKDNAPLYHALLDNANAANLSNDESREARARLNVIIASNPEAVGRCQGLSIEEARNILLEAEASEMPKAA